MTLLVLLSKIGDDMCLHASEKQAKKYRQAMALLMVSTTYMR